MVFAWCVQRIEPEKMEEWLFNLASPLPGEEEVVTEQQSELEGEAFMALMQMNGS